MKSPDSKTSRVRIGWILAGMVLWGAVIAVFYHFASQRRNQADPQDGNTAALHETADTSQTGSSTPQRADDTDVSADNEPSENPTPITIRLPARPLPEFELTEVSGRKITLDDLKGRRWVASFVFSTCTLTCPEITKNLSELRKRLRDTDNDVLFVSITVLPAVDTPEKFGSWADIFRDEDDENWWFLTGDKEVIFNLMQTYFLQYVKEHDSGSVPPGMEVAHSNRVILVNEDAIPVATYLAVNDEDLVRLRRVLTGKEEFPQPGPAVVTGGGGEPEDDGTTAPSADESDNSDDSAEDTSAESAEQRSGISNPSTAVRQSVGTTHSGLAMLPFTERGIRSIAAVTQQAPGGSEAQSADMPDPATDPAGWNQRIEGLLPAWIQSLPPANALLNVTALVLLVAGFRAIRRKRISTHRALMLSAFGVSILFLTNYLTYHWALNHYAGVRFRAFMGEGIWSVLYRVILWPHIAMAALVPILAVITLWHAFRGQWDKHRQIAKLTFPVWVFVSISGVVVYGMLNHWPVG